jgi:hypothetical protein
MTCEGKMTSDELVCDLHDEIDRLHKWAKRDQRVIDSLHDDLENAEATVKLAKTLVEVYEADQGEERNFWTEFLKLRDAIEKEDG